MKGWQLGDVLFPSCQLYLVLPSCHYCSTMAAWSVPIPAVGGTHTHSPCQPVCSAVTPSTSFARCSVRSAMPAALAAWRSVLAGWGPVARCWRKNAMASSSRRSRSAALRCCCGTLVLADFGSLACVPDGSLALSAKGAVPIPSHLALSSFADVERLKLGGNGLARLPL